MPKVNPKDMKPQVYKDPRPAEMFDQYHRSARKGVGWIYDFVRVILTIPTILFYRTRAIGVGIPGHASGIPRLRHRWGLEAAALPQGHDPVRQPGHLPGQCGPEPRRAAARRQPGFRPRPRDVRRPRGERPPRRPQAPARGP